MIVPMLSMAALLTSPAQATTSPVRQAETIVLTSAISVATWTDCASRLIPCAESRTMMAYDQGGQLRLVYTRLSLAEGREEAALPGKVTAFVIRNGLPTSNFGNQYPNGGGKLARALSLLRNGCPATILVDEHDKVIDASTPCHESGE